VELFSGYERGSKASSILKNGKLD